MKFDVCIIGAGIVGLASAYQLMNLKKDLKIAIIDKEPEVAMHQTGHNSGVIHSGVYYKPGSLRALNCRRGYGMLLPFCEEHGIDYDICGKVIVATKEDDRPVLDRILKHGLANGLEGIKIINAEQTKEIEPYVNAVASIWVPQAGIIDYKDVAKKYETLLRSNGQTFYLGQSVVGVKDGENEVVVITSKEEIKCKLAINCAGLYSDVIAKMTMPDIDLKILPFRGEYYELVKERTYLVNNLIYPVPNPHFPFLGVHYTRMIKGGIEAGPNAVLAFKREGYSRWDFDFKELSDALSYKGFHRIAWKYWPQGLDELYRSFSKKAFVKALRHLIPEVGMDDLHRGGSGVRAMACRSDGELADDFIFLEKRRVINVCNAPSPAATASLSVGETIAQKSIKHLNEL